MSHAEEVQMLTDTAIMFPGFRLDDVRSGQPRDALNDTLHDIAETCPRLKERWLRVDCSVEPCTAWFWETKPFNPAEVWGLLTCNDPRAPAMDASNEFLGSVITPWATPEMVVGRYVPAPHDVISEGASLKALLPEAFNERLYDWAESRR